MPGSVNLESKPLIIGLASIWAGGGHNALRDLLLEELEENPNFKIHSFTHSDSSYDWFNDQIFGRAPKFLNFIYKRTPNEYPGISAIKLVKECESFLKKTSPDIVISTNFGVCSAFGFLKHTLKLNFLNIYAIPDYGRTGHAAFPKNRYFKPDYVIVFDIETKKGLVDELEFPQEKILVSGAIARKSFRKLIKENQNKGKKQLLQEINKQLKQKWQIADDKKTYVISGGAGGVINKSYKLLKAISEYQEANPDFLKENQFLIMTGQNQKFRQKITGLRKHKSWQNIYPLPWIEQDVYAKSMLASEFPILITIAPATINQLLTASCGPLLIFHYRTGPELENVAFVIKEGLGIEENDPKAIISWIITGFSADDKARFKELTADYLKSRQQLLEDLPASLLTIFHASKLPQKKKGRFEINYSSISPKILWSIFLLLIPSSLIFAYAQYFKGKKKITQNEYVQKASKLKDRVWPF